MAANSGEAQSVWVSVKGGGRAIEVSTDGLRNVDSFVEKVKEKVHPDLDHVGVHRLLLYKSVQAKANNEEARSECSMLLRICCDGLFNIPRCCSFLGSVCPLLMCCVVCRCVVVALCCQSTNYQNHIK